MAQWLALLAACQGSPADKPVPVPVPAPAPTTPAPTTLPAPVPTSTTPTPGCGGLSVVIDPGDVGDQIVEDISAMPDGDVVVVGTFTYGVTLGATMLHGGTNADMFMAKVAPDGTIRWAVQGGSPSYADQAEALAVGPDGTVAVVGATDGPGAVYGAGTPTEQVLPWEYHLDPTLVVYGPDGAFRWGTAAVGGSVDGSEDVAVAADGTIWWTGDYETNALTFAPGTPQETVLPSWPRDEGEPVVKDAFIAHYRADGVLLGVWSLAGAGNDTPEAMAAAPDGAVWWFGKVVDGTATLGGIQPVALAPSNPFFPTMPLVRYLADGSRAFLAQPRQFIDQHVVLPRKDGAAWISGQAYAGSFDGLGAPEDVTAFIGNALVRWSATGVPDRAVVTGVGVKILAGEESPDGSEIALAGSIYGDDSFMPGQPGAIPFHGAVEGEHTGFVGVVTSDAAPACLWTFPFVSDQNDWPNGVAWDGAGGLWVGGLFSGTATFQPGLPDETVLTTAGGGDTDLFLVRFARHAE